MDRSPGYETKRISPQRRRGALGLPRVIAMDRLEKTPRELRPVPAVLSKSQSSHKIKDMGSTAAQKEKRASVPLW